MRLMGERGSCLNFNQRASEWAGVLCRHWGHRESLCNETMHTLLSLSLRKTVVAPCLLIRAVYLFSPSLATFNTGTMETRGENGITELK